MTERKSVKIEGQKIYYRQWSEGAYPLFCLPGWPASSLCFSPIADALKDKIQIISIDYPGWGGTPKLKNGDGDIREFIPLVAKFINSFKFEKYSILGYSFGGVVLQKMLESEMVNPEKIILMSTFRNITEISAKTILKSSLKIINNVFTSEKNVEMAKRVIAKYVRYIDVNIGHYRKIDKVVFSELLNEVEKSSAVLMLHSLKSIIGLKIGIINFKKYDPLVIYASSDLPFVANDMQEVAYKNNFKQAIVKRADHVHGFSHPKENASFILKHIIG